MKEQLLMFIGIYFIVMNIIAFFAFGWDKRKAKKGDWRISEKQLLYFALLGGSVGALVGMKTFHHKTRKKKFSLGIPFLLILQAVICAMIIIFVLTKT